MMAHLRTPTDDDGLLERIIAEIELLEQQPEQISDIASLAGLFVHLNRCGNVYLQEMVARLASECFASKAQMKQLREMILHLQKQLESITDIHQNDSQTSEGQQLHHTQGQLGSTVETCSPMNVVTAEIDTAREQQLQEEQTVQERNQSQTEINEIDVDITDEGFLLSDSDQMDEDEEIDNVQSSTKEINQRKVISTQTDEQSLGIEDGLPNKITEVERTDQQHEQSNDAGHNDNGNLNKMAVIPSISVHPVEFPGEVQNPHRTQEEIEQTVEASSPIEVDICDTVINESQHFSNQMEQQQEIVSVRDVSSAVQTIERSDILLRSVEQSRIWESSDAQPFRGSTQLHIGEMATANNRLSLDDSTQMEPLPESENVQLSTEQRSEGSGITLLPNVSIDVEQHYEQEGTMPSLQMKVCSVRVRKMNTKEIASNSERSKAPPNNPQNTRKKSGTHSCDECNKCFIFKSHLITHSRVHTGEKPFVCTDCGSVSNQVHDLKSQIKQLRDMILQLQKQLESITDIHQIHSQTIEGQQLHRTQGQLEPTVETCSPMNVVTAEIDTAREQQLQEEQTVQERNQSQTEINEIDVGITDEGFLLSDSDQMDEDEEIDNVQSSTKEINQRKVISTQTDEQSLGIEDGLPNKITEVERTDQQHEQSNDAGHNDNGNLNKMAVIPSISVYPVECPGEVENLHRTQEEIEQTVEASSPMEIEICDTVINESQHFSRQMEQQQEIMSVCDVSSTIQTIERSHNLLRSGEQSRISESSDAQPFRGSTQLQIGEMATTNNRLPLDDSTQMEPLPESENVQLSTEERSEGSGITLLPNVSIDVEQRYEQEGTMPSPQMKVCSVRLRKIDPKRIASNSERSKAPPNNPQNTRKKSGTHYCDECNKCFIFKSHLIRHSRVHTGEKPYVCTDCEVAFTVASSLKTHQRIHSDEKLFICDICKTSFRLKRELLLHMRIHSGKKSYKCNVCKKEFSHKITLKKHIQLHSK